MFEKIVTFMKDRAGLIFGCILFVGVALHCLTLSYSPLPWMDEVQVNEIARGGIGSKDTTWSTALIRVDGQMDRQTWAIYYLGGAISEFAYEALGRTGNRIFNLGWLLLSTLLLFYYVYRKTNNKKWAYLMGLLYFTFPPLIQSVRGGRVDVIALSFLFAALALLQVYVPTKKRLALICILTTCFSAMSVFSWVTAILCMPIILWEVFEIFERHGLNVKQKILMLLLMAWSGILFLGILLLPFLTHYQITFETFMYVLSHNSSVSSGAPYIRALLVELLAFPGIYCIGIIFLLLRKRFILLTVSASMICIIAMMTYCYVFRILYLLPYALIGVALSICYVKKTPIRKVYVVVALCIIGASFAYSILLRNGIEFLTKRVRDSQQLKVILEKEIGFNKKVYCETFQVYYIGRELEWEQYRIAGKVKAQDVIIEKFNIDYYLTENKVLPKNIKSTFDKNGFKYVKKIQLVEDSDLTKIEQGLKRIGRLKPLGPYYLYVRDVKTSNL